MPKNIRNVCTIDVLPWSTDTDACDVLIHVNIVVINNAVMGKNTDNMIISNLGVVIVFEGHHNRAMVSRPSPFALFTDTTVGTERVS